MHVYPLQAGKQMSVGLLGVCLEAVSSLGSDPEQHLHAFVAACPVSTHSTCLVSLANAVMPVWWCTQLC